MSIGDVAFVPFVQGEPKRRPGGGSTDDESH